MRPSRKVPSSLRSALKPGIARNFPRRKDTRHFKIREWLCSGADFSTRRILSCVLQEQMSPMLRGYWRIAGCYLQIQKDVRLYGGPSRKRTILHRRIPSSNPIWAQTGPISHCRLCGQNVSMSALAISRKTRWEFRQEPRLTTVLNPLSETFGHRAWLINTFSTATKHPKDVGEHGCWPIQVAAGTLPNSAALALKNSSRVCARLPVTARIVSVTPRASSSLRLSCDRKYRQRCDK